MSYQHYPPKRRSAAVVSFTAYIKHPSGRPLSEDEAEILCRACTQGFETPQKAIVDAHLKAPGKSNMEYTDSFMRQMRELAALCPEEVVPAKTISRGCLPERKPLSRMTPFSYMDNGVPIYPIEKEDVPPPAPEGLYLLRFNGRSGLNVEEITQRLKKIPGVSCVTKQSELSRQHPGR